MGSLGFTTFGEEPLPTGARRTEVKRNIGGTCVEFPTCNMVIFARGHPDCERCLPSAVREGRRLRGTWKSQPATWSYYLHVVVQIAKGVCAQHVGGLGVSWRQSLVSFLRPFRIAPSSSIFLQLTMSETNILPGAHDFLVSGTIYAARNVRKSGRHF